MSREKIIVFLNSIFNKYFLGYYSHPDKQFHYNMISVHWTPLATWDNYFVAASNAVKVGQHAGQVIGLDLLSKYCALEKPN